MPAKARLTVPGFPHLVRQRGLNSHRLFDSVIEHQIFVDALGQSAAASGCAIHAYAALPYTALVLCTPEAAGSTEMLMQGIRGHCTLSRARVHHRASPPCERGYQQCVVDPREVVTIGYRYVDGAAGRVERAVEPSAYNWSSAGAHLGVRFDSMLSDHDAYAILGGTRRSRARVYRALLQAPISDVEAARVERALTTGLVLGSERFKDQLEQVLGHPIRPGRPRGPAT